jgi:hypothetical protein
MRPPIPRTDSPLETGHVALVFASNYSSSRKEWRGIGEGEGAGDGFEIIDGYRAWIVGGGVR